MLYIIPNRIISYLFLSLWFYSSMYFSLRRAVSLFGYTGIKQIASEAASRYNFRSTILGIKDYLVSLDLVLML